MTQQDAQLLVDLQNVENALHDRGDEYGVLLAAALATYRRRLERVGGFVRLQPDHALDWLKYIEIQQGTGWLRLIDTRVQPKER